MADSELTRVAFMNRDFEGTIEWLVRSLMPQHADAHLASIEATLKT